VDSGNEWRTAISEEFAKAMGFPRASLRPTAEKAVGTAKDGATIRILGEVPEPLRFQFEQGPSLGTFIIRPAVLESLSSPVNISGPFLHHHAIDQLHSEGALKVRGGLVPVHAAKEAPTCWVYAKGNVKAAPRTLTWIPGVASVHGMAVVGLLRGNQQLGQRWGNLQPSGDVRIQVGPDGATEVAVYNPTATAIALQGGSRIASIELRSSPEVRRALAEGPAGPAPRKAKGGTEEKATPEWIRAEVRPRLVESDSALTEASEVEEALCLLERYADIFSVDGSYGQTELLKHAIHTGDVAPIKCRNRPINPALIDDLRAQMELWLRHDVIEESASPWASALVAAPKKNGKTRWCVDYRALNKVTVKDAYPMPLIEDRLAQLARAEIFSSVDGSGAFHVVALEEDAKPKTAFATPWGLYQFKRMPFGLTNAPATYSRLMQIALTGVPTTMALSYLDDTLVHSRDFPRHLAALKMVLEAHRRAGLKLQPEKCQLFKRRLEYLGHIVTARGIQPMDAYLEAVKRWPVPTTLSETRAFLGKVGYYRRFILRYAHLAAPLTDAIKDENLPDPNGKAIRVTPELRESHRALVKALCTAPILAYPRFDAEASFIVDTDWSQEHRAIGAVLSQQQEGHERVIAYGAKKLSKSQANYPATKGELFAVIYFLNHWRYYLKWKKFLLRTDHRALQWIRTMEAPSGMVARWLLTLADYDFEVQYRKGEQHGNADALSRAPHVEELGVLPDDEEERGLAALTSVPVARLCALAGETGDDEEDSDSEEDDDAEPVEWYDKGTTRLPRKASEWAQEQAQDVDLRVLRGWLQHGQVPPKAERRALPPRLRCLADRVGKLQIGPDGVIYAEPHRGKQRPVVPFHLEVAFVRECHELIGHRGIEATAAIAGQSAYLLAGKAAVQHVLAACVPCQVKAGAPRPQRHTYATVKNGYPFQRISIDFVGPLPRTKKGHTMALTVKDPFSKWIEAFPLRRATAEVVAHHLEKDIFTRFGFPEEIHSDRGSQFTGELMTQLGQLLGVRTTVTPAYHPQSNPVERAHRDLKAGLRAALEEAGGQEWDEAIPQILLAFRIAPARGTAMSPFRVLFGRDPPLPIGVIEPAPAQTALVPYVEDLEKRMRVVHEWAAKNLAKEVRRQQMAYGAGGWTPKKGDKVWLYSPAATASTGRKLARPWTGPWGVESVISEVLYRIVDSRGRGVDAALDRLKPFYEPPGGQSDYRPPTDDTSPAHRSSARNNLDNDTSVIRRAPEDRQPIPAATEDGASSDGEGTDTEGDDGPAPCEAEHLGAGSPHTPEAGSNMGPAPGRGQAGPGNGEPGRMAPEDAPNDVPFGSPGGLGSTGVSPDGGRGGRGAAGGSPPQGGPEDALPGGARRQARRAVRPEGQDGRGGVSAGRGGRSGQGNPPGQPGRTASGQLRRGRPRGPEATTAPAAAPAGAAEGPRRGRGRPRASASTATADLRGGDGPVPNTGAAGGVGGSIDGPERACTPGTRGTPGLLAETVESAAQDRVRASGPVRDGLEGEEVGDLARRGPVRGAEGRNARQGAAGPASLPGHRHSGGSATEGAEARPRRRAAAQAGRLLEQWGRTMDRRRRLELIPEEVYDDE
jgi:hypothetical protein